MSPSHAAHHARAGACLLATIAACTPPAQAPCPAIPPPVVASAPVAGATPAPPDESLIKARTHDLFAAIDRYDAAAFKALVGPSYGRFFAGRFYDANLTASGLAERAANHEPVHSRSWSDERIVVGPDACVYMGESIEHVPATADHPAADIDGYDTLVWVRSGGDWKAAE